MDNTMLAKYLDIIEESGLDFYSVTEDRFIYVATEDIDGGQVIIAKFNVDEELVNIYADLSLNSLDEFRNEYIL